MSLIFEKYTMQQGWNESTQIQILLEYIENQQSNDAFKEFLSEKSIFENDASYTDTGSHDNTPLGLQDALSELEEDDDLTLFECEIGLFDLKSDPNTPFETHVVVVAASTIERANEKSQMLCEETIASIANVAYSPTCMASKVDINNYL